MAIRLLAKSCNTYLLHQILVARMADAEPHAAVVVADMIAVIERKPLWPALPPPVFTPDLAGRQFDLVVKHDDVGRPSL